MSCREDNGLLRDLVHTPGAGAVLVVDGAGSLRTALAGDLIAGAAQASGWAGLVLHGGVRDSVALAALDLGVKALGTIPRKSAKTGAGTVDVPVTFGNLTFSPGDVLHADDDGIVLLPPATQGAMTDRRHSADRWMALTRPAHPGAPPAAGQVWLPGRCARGVSAASLKAPPKGDQPSGLSHQNSAPRAGRVSTWQP